MAAVAQPLSSVRAFRTARRFNGRVVVASSLAVLSVLALLVGLSAVVPDTQSVLQATRDLPAGAVVQASDMTAVHVRLPDSMAQVAYAGTASDRLIGHRAAVHVAAGEMLTPAQFATEHVSVAPGRVQLTIPVESYTASAGSIGPGDSVVVYASPRQTTSIGTASALVQQARVVAAGGPTRGPWVLRQLAAERCGSHSTSMKIRRPPLRALHIRHTSTWRSWPRTKTR